MYPYFKVNRVYVGDYDANVINCQFGAYLAKQMNFLSRIFCLQNVYNNFYRLKNKQTKTKQKTFFWRKMGE